MTGLRIARGLHIVIMDDDLQHDPRYIPIMLKKAEQGWDVVYADFRGKCQSKWKNLGSWLNGKVAEWLIGKPKALYLSAYKIISADVAALICDYDGPDPYLDGLLFQVTSRICNIPAEHHKRFAGRSTYTFWKSVGVCARLAFSFSVMPLRLVSLCGFALAALGLIFAVIVVLYRLLYPEDFPPVAVGWASLMVAALLIGGIQMMFFGILGEYAGRTYLKVNSKPQAAIREILNCRVAKSPPTDRKSVFSGDVQIGDKSRL
jgi:glycosyltransferase involved in cell wall biosynthesis